MESFRKRDTQLIRRVPVRRSEARAFASLEFEELSPIMLLGWDPHKYCVCLADKAYNKFEKRDATALGVIPFLQHSRNTLIPRPLFGDFLDVVARDCLQWDRS